MKALVPPASWRLYAFLTSVTGRTIRYSEFPPSAVTATFSRGVMSAFRAGSLRLFRLAGIDVYLHWSWLLVAIFLVQYRIRLAQEGPGLLRQYESPRWYWIEYLSLFAIVLLHEFGHALACQIGRAHV